MTLAVAGTEVASCRAAVVWSYRVLRRGGRGGGDEDGTRNCADADGMKTATPSVESRYALQHELPQTSLNGDEQRIA